MSQLQLLIFFHSPARASSNAIKNGQCSGESKDLPEITVIPMPTVDHPQQQQQLQKPDS